MFVDLRADVADDEGRLGKINWTLRTFMIDELTDYYKNPRSLSEKEFKQLKTSLDKFGMIDKPIVNADSANTIIGGHQRKHVMEATGVKECECWIPDRELSEKEVEELNIRLNKNTGSWDFDTLANEFQLDDLLDWGFDKGELDLDLWADDAPEDVEPQIDKAEELRVKWGVESGQLWQLGEHRLICGRCNDVEIIKKLNVEEDCILVTDPPYCSGGSQEAQKKSGTWGVIDSDNLSTRGYQTLMKSMIQLFPARAYYIFTDWRMWITLYDLMEGEGQPVRNMIVWAKDNPAMGGIWRTQHELILFASQQNQAKEKGEGSIGNVLTSPRTGNKLHFTQKPTELIEKIITNDSTAVGRGDSVVVDGFLGSGTTLIACERLGRKCRAVEISPAYVAVAIQRWVDVTGGEPVLLDT